MQIELLRRKGMMDEVTKDPPFSAKLEKCMEQIEKMKAMLETLMQRSAQCEEEAPQKIRLNDLLEDELLFLSNHLFFKHHVEVRKTLRPGLPLLVGSYLDLREALSNLLLNAVEAMEDTPEKKLTVTTETGDGEVQVMIGDTGEGIPQEIKPQLFKPFVTTKGGKHFGLGLFMAYELLVPYGASFHFTSRRGETIFIVHFPVPD
jgi:C4-dicarboxylate-specific signal transduction histidine kinase